MARTEPTDDQALFTASGKGVWRQLRENPYIFGLASVSLIQGCHTWRFSPVDKWNQFASLGGFLFGYDQGVVSGVLTMESFAARFPRIYMDSGFKGWFVSSLLLGLLTILLPSERESLTSPAAWFGSLVNGPIADRYGRKGSILMAVVVFTVGSAIQAGAISVSMVFAGRFSFHHSRLEGQELD